MQQAVPLGQEPWPRCSVSTTQICSGLPRAAQGEAVEPVNFHRRGKW
jgi:hypothetical protein